MAAQHAPNASEYIVHHLTHLNSLGHKQAAGRLVGIPSRYPVLVDNPRPAVCADPGAAAAKATSGVPGRFQAAVEILVEMVESQSKSIVHGDRSFIAPWP
jgi:F-type H+-transporting ATPase subunit a